MQSLVCALSKRVSGGATGISGRHTLADYADYDFSDYDFSDYDFLQ